MASQDLARLAQYVKARRLALGLARKAAADRAGISKDTWQRVEEEKPVREMNYAKMDPVLGWASGSCTSVRDGREPILSRAAADAEGAFISQRPTEDLDERAREVIQLAVLATAGGLTADEIRALSDRAVRDLRENGII